jgi:sec-independent protein translocase protein TatB
MFDFDAGKLIIIGIVALIVIGPKELPRVLRQVGQAAAKMRRMAAEFRGQFMDAMREADVEDIKADVGKLAESAKIAAVIDPLAEIKAGITSALEAADKPAALPAPEAPALAAPGEADSSSHSIALPRVAEAPPAATDAEMRALADALSARIGDSAGADAAKTENKV